MSFPLFLNVSLADGVVRRVGESVYGYSDSQTVRQSDENWRIGELEQKGIETEEQMGDEILLFCCTNSPQWDCFFVSWEVVCVCM